MKIETETDLKTTETEIAPVEIQKENDSKALTDVEKQIIRQIEYYFGDYNLTRDKFLKETIKVEDGWVSLETMLKFQRLSKISSDAALIMASLKKSDSGLMEVNTETSKIRRNPDKPLPEEETIQKELIKQTVYCKGFEKEKTSLDDLLAFFDKFENVINVFMRTWLDRHTKEKKFKGSVFVTFKDPASAEAFIKLEDVKSPEGQDLIRKWQEAYFEEKKNEMDSKKRKVHEHKAGAKRVKEMVEQEAKKDEYELAKGACLKLENIKDETTREMIKETLEKDFAVAPLDIAFVTFNKGDPKATIRFKKDNMAVELLDKLKSAEKLVINETEVAFSVLEGEEEKEFLEKCMSELKSNRNKFKGHKRRGGFQQGGGRGAKRFKK